MELNELKQLIENETGQKFNKNNLICCPFHAEKTPSFSIYEDGKPKFKCFGCGENGDIIDFIRKYKDLDYIEALKYLSDKGYSIKSIDMPHIDIISYVKWQLNHLSDMKGFKISEIYNFKDHLGNVKYYKVKFKTDDGKQCRYYSIVNDKVQCKRNGEELPYNLYRLVKSKSNTVYIVEGEKDADTLSKMGYLAVSLKGFQYYKFNCRFFKNKNIIVIPDNDQPGQNYKNDVIKGLKPFIKSYKVFPIEQYAKEPGQDITDLFKLKYLDKEQFNSVLKDIKPKYTYLTDNGKINSIKLAKLILNCEDIIYTNKEGFFHYEDGYYKLKDDDKNTLMKQLISSYLGDSVLNNNRIKNEVLSQLMELTVIEEIEPNNQYLNFKNCLLKVTKEGIEVLDHTPDIITIHRFDYDFERVDYKDSNYYKGLKYALYDNTDIVEFLQQFAGACLMPNARLMKAALIISGAKGTGKSTFIEPLQEMLTGLFEAYDLKTLEDDKYILSYLVNKKCILSTDDGGKPLETCHRLKKLIYGESVPTDRKFKSNVSLNLNLAIIIGLNDIPKFNDPSNAIFDRLHFIEFKRKIRGTEKEDPHFIEKIKRYEMLQVINFALDGLVKLLKNNYKLIIPKEMQAFKENIIVGNSPLESWLYSCTEMCSNDDFTTLKDLYDSYLGYCLSELSLDYREVKKECGKQQFNNILQGKGFEFKNEIRRAGIKYKSALFGIKLNTDGRACLIKAEK
ncbi:CHC2 zinc finger domain-containing protein [Haloimpatiens lingqiaonensis]|uniref:CHC2 zinc finger domain-containing protein n=1 Tax=Haloimpatiens lingqiaonensis TaxID=1380675 RepID=UPI0010FD339D|nr:CHC2 zinc finger domain-containing protein [Haloimpatiens lingqiaonensis]